MDVNAILGTALGALGASILSPILLAAYKAFRIKDKLQEGASGIIELAGQSAGKKLNLIKDKEMRHQFYIDTKESADKFDDAFIAGLDKTYRED